MPDTINLFFNNLTWIKVKLGLVVRNSRPSFKEREIFWCAIGQNIGDEMYGKGHTFSRPVLIFKKFNKNLAMIIPLSTKIKDNLYYHNFHFQNKEISALLSHIRTIDTARLENKLGDLPESDFDILKQKILNVLK